MTPNSICYVCGGNMVTGREKSEIKIGNRAAVVDVLRSQCKECGEIFYTPEEMDRAQMAAAEQLRKEDDLLGPAEIRRIRTQFGLTQTQLEQLLGVGPKTVVRWERGTVCQSRTADELLRMICSIPAVYDYLAHRNGIHVIREHSIARPQTSHYVLVEGGSVKRVGRRVVDIAEFASRKTQHKKIVVEREAALPEIPVEALR